MDMSNPHPEEKHGLVSNLRIDACFQNNGTMMSFRNRDTGRRADLCKLVQNPQSLTLSRGLPIWHNAIDKFQDLDRYIEAELLGAMAAACVVGSIESPAGPNALGALNVQRAAPVGTPNPAAAGNTPRKVELAPGSMVGLYPGEKFNMHSTQRPNSVFPDYLRINIRMLGIPVGMPLEIALMDFGETVFAGAKMAMGQAMVSMYVWQDLVVAQQMLRTVYLDWLREVSGLTIPATVKSAEAFEALPPPVPWIDPYREAGAINLGLMGNWDTVTHIVKEHMGRDLESVLRERAHEMKLAQEIGREEGVDGDQLLRPVAPYKPVEPAAEPMESPK
jgi:capsid protein